MSMRLINPTAACDIKPGDKVDCFGQWYWVRYINNHGGMLTLRLQPEHEPLSPYYVNDRITVTVPGDLMIDVKVR